MNKQKGFTLKELITVMIIIAVLGIVLFGNNAKAHHSPGHPEQERYVVGFNYLCCSKHTSAADNENHRGIGLTLTLPESDSMVGGATFGIMSYKNSHNKNSVMLTASKEFWHIADTVHVGLGVGIASGYEEEMSVPLAGWISARYKWFVIAHVPATVTTIGLHIPFAAFK